MDTQIGSVHKVKKGVYKYITCHQSIKMRLYHGGSISLQLPMTLTIINQLEAGRLKKIQDNRQYVMYLLEVILCCSQQGLALRGHREVQNAEEAINIGNFRSFVRLHSRHIPLLQKRLQSCPKNATLLSHDYQNSMIAVLARKVMEYVVSEIKTAHYYTLIVDETKDISKKEQLTLVLRYVLNSCVYERFISYTQCDELHAAALTLYILEGLHHINLDITDCVSQCYDGASVMSDACNGVKVKIMEQNPRAIYIHCHAHQLNLALVDSCEKLPSASDFFGLLEQLYVFMSSSVPHSLFLKNKRSSILQVRYD